MRCAGGFHLTVAHRATPILVLVLERYSHQLFRGTVGSQPSRPPESRDASSLVGMQLPRPKGARRCGRRRLMPNLQVWRT